MLALIFLSGAGPIAYSHPLNRTMHHPYTINRLKEHCETFARGSDQLVIR